METDDKKMAALLAGPSSKAMTGEEYRRFRSVAGAIRPNLSWLEMKLSEAIDSRNHPLAKRLVDVIGMKAYSGKEGASLSDLLSKLLDDPNHADYVETILEILADLDVDSEVLKRVTAVCTSDSWSKQGYWPDLRKAVEIIYLAYEKGSCSRSQVIDALGLILDSKNAESEDVGMRELAAEQLDRLTKS